MRDPAEIERTLKTVHTENLKIRQTVELQAKMIEELRSEIRKMERKLRIHDNHNTPPSQKNRFGHGAKGGEGDGNGDYTPKTKRKMGRNRSAGTGRKRGGQKGHNGITNKPKPTEFEEHTPQRCPKCGSYNLHIEETETQDVTRVERTVKVITTRHTINSCSCRTCGRKDIVPKTNLPKKGSYDASIVTEVADNFAARMPFKVMVQYMSRHGIKISTGTANNIMCRLGTALKNPVMTIILHLLKAEILHADETSIRLNGKLVWVWVFLNPRTGDTLFVIHDKRSGMVPLSILKDWKGVLVCDGWSAYKSFTVQRCWAHITREGDDIADRNEDFPDAQDIAEQLHKIYADAKDTSKDPSYNIREKACHTFHDRINEIVAKYGDSKVEAVRKFMTKLKNANDDLFRFVINPEIQSTNNAAERALREIVVHRKIRGGIKAEKTKEWMANFFSCITTWKNQKLDYLAEMAKYV